MIKFDSEGNIWSYFMLDYSDFDKGIKHVTSTVDLASTDMYGKVSKTMDRASKEIEKHTKSWWQRFGRVALGFTVAYRALNVFEAGVRVLVGEMYRTLTVIDEFNKQAISTTAILISLSKVKNPFETFGKVLPSVKDMLMKMEIVAARHLVTAEELQTTYAAFAKRGIFAGPKDIENVAIIADTIKLIAERSGQTYQQLQEVYGLMDGQVGRGRQLAALIKGMHPDLKTYIEDLEIAGFNMDDQHSLLKQIAEVDLLGIKAASKSIWDLWETQLATIKSIWSAIQRIGGADIYERLVEHLKNINTEIIVGTEYSDKLVEYAETWRSLLEMVYQFAALIREQFTMIGVDVDKINVIFKILSSIFRVTKSLYTVIGTYIKQIGLVGEKVIAALITKGIVLISGFFSDILNMAAEKAPRFARGTLESISKSISEWASKQDMDVKKWFAGFGEGFNKVKGDLSGMLADLENIWKSVELGDKVTDDIFKNIRGQVKALSEETKDPWKKWKDDIAKMNAETSVLNSALALMKDGILEDEEAMNEFIDEGKTLMGLKLDKVPKDIADAFMEAYKNNKRAQKVLDDYIDSLSKATDLVSALRLGWEDFAEDTVDGWGMIRESVTTTSNAASDALTDYMTNAAGEARTFGNLLKGIFTSLNQVVAKYISNLILANTLGKAIGAFVPTKAGSAASAPIVGGIPIMEAHGGLSIPDIMPRQKALASDELLIKAQKGETILPKGIKPITNIYNITNNVQAIDTKSALEYMREHPEVVLVPYLEAKEMGAKL